MNTGLPDVVSIPAAVGEHFPSASPFSVFLQSETEHVVNLHCNSPAVYEEIAGFLIKNGFGPE
ncbi:hypothetical protein K432DRAFT_324233 [Lepidopterella palustris CBS 459.81]|uniref:Uncharacterized protein n=1 Tax=Lepidopterella palustris CBS 459.81 TaxID=1314670 RepID=A0A8E2EEU4_9PEZI|nr:hypothetical protein K432DRAFT_324233 [Lepidopterella palustris CBS 459.81]